MELFEPQKADGDKRNQLLFLLCLTGVESILALLKSGWGEFAKFWIERIEELGVASAIANPDVIETYNIERAKMDCIRELYINSDEAEITVHGLQTAGPKYHWGLSHFRTAKRHLEANVGIGRLRKIGPNRYKILEGPFWETPRKKSANREPSISV